MNKIGKKGKINVVILLLILAIIIVGIAIIYNLVTIFLDVKDFRELKNKIIEPPAAIESSIEPYIIDISIDSALIKNNNKTLAVILSRVGAGEISSLKFILTDSYNRNYSINKYDYPSDGKTKAYNIESSSIFGFYQITKQDFSKIVKFSVVYGVMQRSGEETFFSSVVNVGGVRSVSTTRTNITRFTGGGGSGGGHGGGGGGGCADESTPTTCGTWVCGNKQNNCGNTVSCGSCDGYCSLGSCLRRTINVNSCTIFNEPNVIYNLTADIIADRFPCFIVNATNTAFEGNGHLILNTTTPGIIIYVNQNNTEIKNCRIENVGGISSVGIYVNHSKNVYLNNNLINSTGYGIYLLRALSNSLTNNIITNSLKNGISIMLGDSNILNNNIAVSNSLNSDDSGIYIMSSYNNLTSNRGISNSSIGISLWSSPSKNNILINNTGISNSSVGIYLFIGAENNILINNTGISNSGSGIFSYGSFYNILTRNKGISNSSFGIGLQGNSNNNLLIDNTGISNSDSAVFIQNGHNNIILLQNATAYLEGSYGYYLRNETDLKIKDCIYISGKDYDIFTTGNILDRINALFLNCSYNLTKESVNGMYSQIIRKWYYKAHVSDSSGRDMTNSNVTAWNVSGSQEFLLATNGSGWTNITEITDYINLGGTRSYYSEYTINATNGSLRDEHKFNATSVKNQLNDIFIFELPDLIYPVFSNYRDNNASLLGLGTALFNVNVQNTNGTVFLEINDKKYYATNLTYDSYNVSVMLPEGTYPYYWGAYGNGKFRNYNLSSIRYYTVNSSNIDSCTSLTRANVVYHLQNNVNSSGTCFRIWAQNLTLDCQGYTINYSQGSGTGSYGVFSNQFNSTIKNCNIVDGNKSVSSSGIYTTGIYPTIYNNTVYSNFTGIYVAGGHFYNVSFNSANSTGSAGIYIQNSNNGNLNNNYGESVSSGYTKYAIALDKNINATAINNIGVNNQDSFGFCLYMSNSSYILNNTGISSSGFGIGLHFYNYFNNLTNNTGASTSGYGIYLTYSPNNILIGNIGISNSSHAAYFQASDNNTVKSLNATGYSVGSTGIFLRGSSNLIISDCVQVSGYAYDVYLADLSTNNIFLNCSYNKEFVSSANSLFRKWYYKAFVEDQNGNPMVDMEVAIFNRSNDLQSEVLTGQSGFTPVVELTDYANIGGVKRYYSNYTINVTFETVIISHSRNITEERNIVDVFVIGEYLEIANRSIIIIFYIFLELALILTLNNILGNKEERKRKKR